MAPESDTPDSDDEPEPVADLELFEAAGRALVTPRGQISNSA